MIDLIRSFVKKNRQIEDKTYSIENQQIMFFVLRVCKTSVNKLLTKTSKIGFFFSLFFSKICIEINGNTHFG